MLDYEKTNTYDYVLPPELIAMHPTKERQASRLLIVPKTQSKKLIHEKFENLSKFLRPNDLLIFNNTKVVQARLKAQKPTGGAVELFVLSPSSPMNWSESPTDGRLVFRCMTKSSKRIREGSLEILGFGSVDVSEIEPGLCTLTLAFKDSLEVFLKAFGQMPLPPYILKRRRELEEPEYSPEDDVRYQTVFAEHSGAVAAPTAGLHFDKKGIEALHVLGVKTSTLTLHVGIGTFRPVRVEDLRDHPMHSEDYEISDSLGQSIQDAKKAGGRIIAVGTTSARALESEGQKSTPFLPGRYATDIFIKPGYDWKVCDGLLTNFHLPKSTLLALVYALAEPDKIRQAYIEAIDERYRFYSYGDAMLIM